MHEWRKSEGLTGRQMLDMPPLWLLVHLLALWVLHSALARLAMPHPALRAAGALLVVAGVGLMLWAIAHFRLHQTSVVPHQQPQSLVTTGPFRLSRNPIYLSDLMILLGAALWLGAWIGLPLVWLLGVILSRRFIALEEVRLKQNFETEFTAYAKRTRRWL